MEKPVTVAAREDKQTQLHEAAPRTSIDEYVYTPYKIPVGIIWYHIQWRFSTILQHK